MLIQFSHRVDRFGVHCLICEAISIRRQDQTLGFPFMLQIYITIVQVTAIFVKKYPVL